jgi:hypothetical protein
MKNVDFEIFKKEKTWFQRPDNFVEIEIVLWHTSDNFVRAFPKMAELLNKSRKTGIKKDGKPYILFSWDCKRGGTCGWLCSNQKINEWPFNLIDEHILLCHSVFNIEESYNNPPGSFTLNQNYMFDPQECKTGIGGLDIFYNWKCTQENKKPVDHSKWIAFACEANGNYTLYDPVTKNVYLFASDHAFKNITVLRNQPEFTFYTINGAPTFTDYVELLARQWLEWVV